MSCVNPYICRKEPFDFLTVHNSRILPNGHIEFFSYKNKNFKFYDINEDVEESKKNGYGKLRLHQLSLLLDNLDLQKFLNQNNLILIPCGRCNDCVRNKKREWTLRNSLEFRDKKIGYFITLTFDEDSLMLLKMYNKYHLATLSKKVFTDFMKRFRKNYKNFSNESIRFFACGEYGSKTFRPHYHIVIFNELDVVEKIKTNNRWHYTSKIIQDSWEYGIYDIEELNNYAISYVSGYVQKKMLNNNIDFKKFGVEPPFITMSRKPGIAYNYFIENLEKIYKYDGVYDIDFTSNKVEKFPTPKFFDRQLKKIDVKKYEEIKNNRVFTYVIPDTDKKIYLSNFKKDSKIKNKRSESI